MNNKQKIQDLENGKITPRTLSAPKKAIADAMEPIANSSAKSWSWGMLCAFFLHQPKLPKKLQKIE